VCAVRALIVCTHPKDYVLPRLQEAARYMLDRRDTTDEKQRPATEAIEWLRGKRDEPLPHDGVTSQHEVRVASKQAAGKQTPKKRTKYSVKMMALP